MYDLSKRKSESNINYNHSEQELAEDIEFFRQNIVEVHNEAIDKFRSEGLEEVDQLDLLYNCDQTGYFCLS